MPDREATSKQPSTPPQPSRNDSVTIGTCDLCGEPYRAGDVVQALAPAQEGGPLRRVHMNCFHSRVILERAMARTSRRKTPSI